MKPCISNIAWNFSENSLIYSKLKEYAVALEIAPSIFLGDDADITDLSLGLAKKQSLDNVSIASMQGILFGTKDLFVFDENTRPLLLKHLKNIIDLANVLKIPNIVFGAPKNRNIPRTLDAKLATKIAIEFFSEIAEYSKEKNVYFALEPNAESYGTNFLNTTKETLLFLKQVNHPNLSLNLDFGTMTMNLESSREIESAFPYISHVHLSEPFLDKINFGLKDIHLERINLLKKLDYKNYISIEMKRTELEAVEDAIIFLNELIAL